MVRYVWLLLCSFLTLTSGQCPTRQCSCTQDIVDCHGRRLNYIPTFTDTGKKFNQIRLGDNRIRTVPNDAFHNIAGVSIIDLNDNLISDIEDDAFKGLETTVFTLYLRNNLLRNLSTAIGKLENVINLDVSVNRIPDTGFDDEVMRDIGDTITRFDFGSSDVKNWPHTLRHLQALDYLNVTGGSYYTLPPDAFHGFDGTLTSLSIRNTELIAIPLALSRLRYLERLYFDHNHAIGDAGILVPAFSGQILGHLEYLSLQDDMLTLFPSILKYLHNVKTLVLSNNPLTFVSDTSVNVVAGTNIENLILRNCSLSRVPGAFSQLTKLKALDLSQNSIHSFERNDFEHLTNLENISLAKNPLEYISLDAFVDLHSLNTLDFRNTSLKEIPEAISKMRNLSSIAVPDQQVECTCSLAWLRKWMNTNSSNLKVIGTCETIISTIQNYLASFIPKCPNYNITG